MLSELYIRNFAIIDELRFRFSAGFNVLTGETGAGKSIILDAVSLILGGRADTAMVRSGCAEAYVEAAFTLSRDMQAVLSPLLVEEGLDEGEDNHLLLARDLRLNGRNICRVNGRAVTLTLLRQIAEPLVDIHGQGEHLSLLKARSHLPLLDSYAGLGPERTELAREVKQLQKIQRELKELRQNERALAQRIDLLQFQIQEIGAANLEVGEEEELRAERTRLANAEQLMQAASEAVSLMIGLDDAVQQSAVDLLGQAERALSQLARYDETQATHLEDLQGLSFQVNELAAELQDYLDDLEFNPARLDFVEERLELINRLKRKYGDTVEEILAQREKAAAELEQINRSEERVAELETEQDRYLHRIGDLASSLSQKRQRAAEALAAAVEQELTDLRMDGAQFTVDFGRETAADGAYVDEQRLAFDQTGIDRVEFLISTNIGEPLKPMARVASGGETSRLMLALKTVLARVDATPTLIFDEVDQGIGGRVGDVVGRKLWGLTAVAQHQVIVVTHLPQLAGYGDAHFHVSKQLANGRTVTTVVNLDEPGQVDELAAMLGTQGEHARGGAESILQQVTAAKKEVKNA